ncbi:NAD(+) diphosphatase [Levilactobacillus mulengensis]|uniref:NAD(+) diphosphatase n=1 Tax=Levilactobacillus mulengensis TaxID=2486025 RepID=UPI000F76A8FD|nr:NAD(+) diphosphatase [Levilactobacillus mulengensis]
MMFQDISPKVFDNHYEQRRAPRDSDYVVIYDNRQIILGPEQRLPNYREAVRQWQLSPAQMTYLFSVDETGFYLVGQRVATTAAYQYQSVASFQKVEPAWLGFAGATAAHLAWWYETNRFCGRCGHAMRPDEQQRALTCGHCGYQVFPRISPVVVVGVTKGDQILLTQYAAGYKPYTLISGFAEIGETLEDAVRREVQEEVGLHVHNLRYFGSQPWAFSESLLVGFFAELDEDVTIDLERDELAQAKWFDRDKMPTDGAKFILAYEMRKAFRDGRV